MNIKDLQKYQEHLKGRIDFLHTDRLLLDLLVILSVNIDMPLKITSSFRSPELNRTCGGSPTSSHLKGLAVDIVCTESSTRYKIINAAISLNFVRIGVYDKHIHLDIDHSKPVALWLGKSK